MTQPAPPSAARIEDLLVRIQQRTGLSRVAAARRLRSALANHRRQSLPTIADPTPAEADAARAESLRSFRDTFIENGIEYLVAADGTYQATGTDPYRGLKAVAAGEVLGLTRTHSVVEVKRGMITVTLIQPPRRDAQSIRGRVVQSLVDAPTDGAYQSEAGRLHVSKAERKLADRVRALQGVGDRTGDDWDIRRRVGVTISEIRSK